MWLSILASVTLLIFSGSDSWAQDSQPSFSVRDPLGDLVFYNLRNKKHYLGYFCLERETPGDKSSPCVLTQYGIGEDLLLEVDSMGNPTSERPETWIGYGPVFNKSTADDFYNRSMQSSPAFQEVWQKIWTREGWNHSQIPVETSKQTAIAFLKLLEPTTTEPIEEEKIKKKKLLGKWSLGMWKGSITVSRYNKLQICLSLEFYEKYFHPHRSKESCYHLRNGSLVKGKEANTYQAFDKNGAPIYFKFSHQKALLLTVTMIIPVNGKFKDPGDGKEKYRTEPRQETIQCSKIY